jgi:hypothetical protein
MFIAIYLSPPLPTITIFQPFPRKIREFTKVSAGFWVEEGEIS